MREAFPSVTLIALTKAVTETITEFMDLDPELPEDDAMHVVEFSGRACYQSHHKPNPATASNAAYLGNIQDQKHYSVLEHSTATFYLAGVSRNCTHELVRHRHFSFSELSGRYVDPFKAGLGYIAPPGLGTVGRNQLELAWSRAEPAYYAALDELRQNGISGKKAREAARSILPGSLETRISITGNMRSWMEFISKRDHPAADAEMRKVAAGISDILSSHYPAIFGLDGRSAWDDQYAQAAPKADQ